MNDDKTFMTVIPPSEPTKEERARFDKDWVNGGGEIGRIVEVRIISSPVILTPFKRKQARRKKK